MSEIQKTNVCCLDLRSDCVDYLRSLDLNVYEGSLGSVFTVKWEHTYEEPKRVVIDVDIPVNLHEYHVVIVDTDNPHFRKYKPEEHLIQRIESGDMRHLECCFPVNQFDLRPFGTQKIAGCFRNISRERRIEIIFVGRANEVDYTSNTIGGYSRQNIGTFSNIEGWHFVSGREKFGKRIEFEDNRYSRLLFEGRRGHVNYYRVFFLPTDHSGNTDKRYLSLLSNESGESISYVFFESEDYIKFVLPQVEDKAGLLKDLFENVIFKLFSDYFPDVEMRNWIHSDVYLLPDEIEIQNKIIAKQEELEQEIAKLEHKADVIKEKNGYLKQLFTESGSALVSAVKSFFDWLGFENVIDKDETLKEGELKEEDLCFDYDGNHVVVEVKGIIGTSTDSECSQIDKIVSRRMRQLGSTDVHGIYVVNNQKNVEPLKRNTPPFNENQIQDAKSQSRTMVYTPQLFALYSDIENGFITKEQARQCMMQPGLAQFHEHLISMGVPYNYFQDDTIICLDLNDTKVKVGDILYYKDDLQRLIGLRVECVQQDGKDLQEASLGRTGIKVNRKVPRNREILQNTR